MKISEERAAKAIDRRREKADAILSDTGETEELLKKTDQKIEKQKNLTLLRQIPKMGRMLKSFIRKEYTEVPVGTLGAIAASLLYFVSPVDILPDFSPFLGYVDDAAVVALCVNLCQYDLSKFEEWELSRQQKDSIV